MNDVVKKHEEEHIKDFKKDPIASKVCVGITLPGTPFVLPIDITHKSECRVYQYITIPDLTKRISKAKTDTCKKFLQKQLAERKVYYNYYGCGRFKDANGNCIFTNLFP